MEEILTTERIQIYVAEQIWATKKFVSGTNLVYKEGTKIETSTNYKIMTTEETKIRATKENQN
jgi:hypothetical protein